MGWYSDMNKEDRLKIERILENQEVILLALSKFTVQEAATMQSMADVTNKLIDCYHATRMTLGKSYIKR